MIDSVSRRDRRHGLDNTRMFSRSNLGKPLPNPAIARKIAIQRLRAKKWSDRPGSRIQRAFILRIQNR
jgi:hypothetical protein